MRSIAKQNVLTKRPCIQSSAALFLLRRKYESITYYLKWEKHRKEYLATQEMCCHYCGTENLLLKSKNPDTLATIDHVIPRALGGRDEPSNYVVACETCNKRKGAKLVCPRRTTLVKPRGESRAHISA